METYDLAEAARRIGVEPAALTCFADFTRAGEVVVSQAVVDASGGVPVIYRDVGPVELKGVSGTMILHAASLQA